MENKLDIREIAQYCKNEYQQNCEKADNMCHYSIHYAAISKDGKMRVSRTPHILEGAQECFLIHSWDQKAETRWYRTYDVQRVNVNGEVGGGDFDDEYSFSISEARFSTPEMISLRRNGQELYCESLLAWGNCILAKRLEYVWDLYKKCKRECKTQYESELLCELAAKEESIKDLEASLADSTIKERYLRDEVAQYRKLLDEIQLALKTIS